jgi:hypothetical protein
MIASKAARFGVIAVNDAEHDGCAHNEVVS